MAWTLLVVVEVVEVMVEVMVEVLLVVVVVLVDGFATVREAQIFSPLPQTP